MGLVGMVGYMLETSYRGAISMVSRLIIDASQDYGLSVVPLFILMGLFVNKGGISKELYRVSFAFLGHFRGGLAMATFDMVAAVASDDPQMAANPPQATIVAIARPPRKWPRLSLIHI